MAWFTELPLRRRRSADRSLRAVRRLAWGSGVVWAGALLAGAFRLPGGALLAGTGKLLFLLALIVMFALRGASSRRDRLAWWCFSAASTAYLCGGLSSEIYSSNLGYVPHPSWADAAYMSFYPLAYAALFLMLRARVGRLPSASWLDGIVTGLTAAALATAFALGPLLRTAGSNPGGVVTAISYPLADILLLILVGGALAVIGRGAGAGLGLLSAGLTLFVVTDTLYAFQVVHGTYTTGGPLDLGWELAFFCFGLAACQAPGTRQMRRLEGRGGLVVPGACALAAVGLLFHGYLSGGDPVAGMLALGAVLSSLARTALAFRAVRALAESRQEARTDELTGLLNRRGVFEALTGADRRLSAGGGVTVLVLDLDRFKEVNDSLGHLVGDGLLRQIGPRLRGQLRGEDQLARLGGDEFVVIAEDVPAATATALAARLRERLQAPFEVEGMTLSIDVSIGVAVGPDHSTKAHELLQMADLAMYAAKAGRTGWALYDQMRHGDGRHRLEEVAQLRRGIDEGELVLHYQPKLTLVTGTVDGVEALVRWQHPERGLLYPDAFVELAESAGLMPQLTTVVLEQALTQCRLWAEQGRPLSVAVNVSPSTLVDDAFPDQIAALLTAHGVPPHSLILEVTESLLMEDRERSERVLGRLREEGVGLSIDDYGTGYSSLAYLAALPVTELKLDRSFIAAMTGSWRAESIVISTLQLAHALGLVLVAEGAEDQATVDALAALGCDVVQGYHLSRPLPPEQLWSWLEVRDQARDQERRESELSLDAVGPLA